MCASLALLLSLGACSDSKAASADTERSDGGRDAGGIRDASPGEDGAAASTDCVDPAPGRCSEARPYYRYNSRLGRCEPFDFTGCPSEFTAGAYDELVICSARCTGAKWFLARCDSTDDCLEGMACQSGHCSPSCTQASDCANLAHQADCGPDGYCGLSCSENSDCQTLGRNFSCEQGRCLPYDCEVTRAVDVCEPDGGACNYPKTRCREAMKNGCEPQPECAACIVDNVAPERGTDCQGSVGLACEYAAFGDLKECRCEERDGSAKWDCEFLLSI